MASLKEFAQDILTHLDGGEAPKWFTLRCGLCANWRDYCRMHGTYTSEGFFALFAAFEHENLSELLPFDSDIGHYLKAGDDSTIYQNPARLAFLHKLANGEPQ